MPLLNQTAAFSQVDVMSGAANAAATAGACHNFSLQWIAAMYADSDPAKAAARMTALAKNKGGAAMVTQAIFGNEWDRQGAEAADKGVAAWRGLAFVRDLVPYSAWSNSTFLQGLCKADVSGIIFSFWFQGSAVGAEGGAHTIAFFRKMRSARGSTGPADNLVFAFDPNFGECLVVEGQLSAWVTDMLSNYGPCDDQWMRGFKKA